MATVAIARRCALPDLLIYRRRSLETPRRRKRKSLCKATRLRFKAFRGGCCCFSGCSSLPQPHWWLVRLVRYNFIYTDCICCLFNTNLSDDLKSVCVCTLYDFMLKFKLSIVRFFFIEHTEHAVALCASMRCEAIAASRIMHR